MKKKVLDIFARIWALWGLISFLTTFLIVYPFFLFSFLIPGKRNSQSYFIFISKYWMKIWLTLIGCRLTISGKEHFIKGKNYIVVFNHNTLLDVPLSSPFIPDANKTIAKSSFSKIPLFGLFYSKGSVLVDRSNEKSRIKSYEGMKDVLKDQMHMCIYPEGTRNRSALPLKRFYDGAFKLSIETQKEIIPCIISGTKDAMPIQKKFYLLPHPLKLTFIPPVHPKGRTVKELNNTVFEIMWKALTNEDYKS